MKTIIVVGAGVIGCSIAWELSKKGCSVTLIEERSELFGGTSSAGFGSLTPVSDPFYDGEARDLAIQGVALYRNQWLRELASLSGKSISFSDLGLLQLCADEEGLAHGAAFASMLQATGQKATLLTVEQTRELEPALRGDFLGSLLLDEPWLDRAEYFQALGYVIARAPNIHIQFDTRVSEVLLGSHSLNIKLDSGKLLEVDGVVVCTGLHTMPIQGLPQIPMQWIRGDAISMYTTDGKPLLKRHVYLKEGFITPRHHSEMLLGATYVHEQGFPSENARCHCDRIELKQFEALVSSNVRILPALASCEVGKVWRNWRPTTLDEWPILGALTEDRRVVLANGFVGLGITVAPAVATKVAEYLAEFDAGVFPGCFHPQRPSLFEGV